MAEDFALDILEGANEVVKASQKLMTDLTELLDSVISAIDDVTEKCNALHNKKIDLDGQEEDLRRKVERAAEKAYVYTSSVDNLYQCAGDETRQKKIRQKLENDDLSELNSYISELQTCLDKCEESYQNAQKSLNELISDAQKTERFCEKKASEADTKMKVGAAVSSVIGIGALTTGGMAVSAMAGIFTFEFEVGTIIGLGVTSVAAATVSGVVALCAGITPYRFTSSYREMEKEFKHLELSFDKIQQRATRIESFINVLKTELISVANAVDRANPANIHSEFVTPFDRLCEAFGNTHEEATFRKRLLEADSELRARFSWVLT